MVQNVKRTAGNTLASSSSTRRMTRSIEGQRRSPALVHLARSIPTSDSHRGAAIMPASSSRRAIASLRCSRRNGNLQPDQQVLDIGSGIGRIARALTTYLSKDGQYRGFDVIPPRVALVSALVRSSLELLVCNTPRLVTSTSEGGERSGEKTLSFHTQRPPSISRSRCPCTPI